MLICSCFVRLLWYVIQLCGLAGACYIFLYALDGFVSKPTFTSLERVDYPIWEIPFPAVAVCSVNKISRKAAMSYAIELWALIVEFILVDCLLIVYDLLSFSSTQQKDQTKRKTTQSIGCLKTFVIWAIRLILMRNFTINTSFSRICSTSSTSAMRHNCLIRKTNSSSR